MRIALSLIAVSAALASGADEVRPDPKTNPGASLMLEGPWVPADTHTIDFDNLPRIPHEHAVVSDVRAADGVNQHNYLIHHDGQFWVMWSDGPAVEDRAGQRVKYATSPDGLDWSEPEFMTPIPPNSGPGTAVYNTRSEEGFRWIARGFWNRDGELLALASLDESADFFGPSLKLYAFSYDKEAKTWSEKGLVYDNAINNFAPKKIGSGEWMMSRRTWNRDVYFLVGGVEAYDKWESFPVVFYGDETLKAEEPYWWVLPGGDVMALFRDNAKSGYLFRSFSTDNGRTWSPPAKTNFPDATSKFNGLQMSDGRFVLVSNPKPGLRDPLCLSISDDGMVFNKMGYLVGGRWIDYPHVIEHDGYLYVAFAGWRKQACEVIKIRIADLAVLDSQGR